MTQDRRGGRGAGRNGTGPRAAEGRGGARASAGAARSAGERRSPAASGASAGAGPLGSLERAKQQLKLFMFVGSGVLVLVVIVLLFVRKPWESAPPPPPPVVIKDEDKVAEVRALREKASKTFAAAQRLEDVRARNEKIREALEILSEAQEKLTAISEKYPGEDWDQVFEPLQSKISQDVKSYRDAIRPLRD